MKNILVLLLLGFALPSVSRDFGLSKAQAGLLATSATWYPAVRLAGAAYLGLGLQFGLAIIVFMFVAVFSWTTMSTVAGNSTLPLT